MKTTLPITFTHPNFEFDMAWMRRHRPELFRTLDRVVAPGGRALVFGVGHAECTGPACRMCRPTPRLDLPPRYAFSVPHALVLP